MSSENAIRLFGLNNLAIESSIRALQTDFQVDLGKEPPATVEKDDTYYPQFDARIRQEASSMGKYYEMFYCLGLCTKTQINPQSLATAANCY